MPDASVHAAVPADGSAVDVRTMYGAPAFVGSAVSSSTYTGCATPAAAVAALDDASPRRSTSTDAAAKKLTSGVGVLERDAVVDAVVVGVRVAVTVTAAVTDDVRVPVVVDVAVGVVDRVGCASRRTTWSCCGAGHRATATMWRRLKTPHQCSESPQYSVSVYPPTTLTHRVSYVHVVGGVCRQPNRPRQHRGRRRPAVAAVTDRAVARDRRDDACPGRDDANDDGRLAVGKMGGG